MRHQGGEELVGNPMDTPVILRQPARPAYGQSGGNLDNDAHNLR